MNDVAALLDPLRSIHDQIRDAVVLAAQRQEIEQLAAIERDEEGDTVYAIDAVSEKRLLELFESLSRDHSFVLIAEGLRGGQIVLPRGTAENDADWRVIVDPIDGTRGLMYQKRSAWILTGVAPNRGANTSLKDIALAVQTEIPLIKQHLSDQLWAIRGKGTLAERLNRLTGKRQSLRLGPSTSPTIAHGFAMVARFFPGARAELASIDDEIVCAVLGPVQPGKAQCFEDQYISSGGQLYELMSGHDRFVADLRPLLGNGLCCHPYDLCAVLIATELGVIVTDAQGHSLDAPLNVGADVSWVGYANGRIRQQIEPALQRSLRSRGWITC